VVARHLGHGLLRERYALKVPTCALFDNPALSA
jgi:hypothetical protein